MTRRRREVAAFQAVVEFQVVVVVAALAVG
jgi:hypothetical protein